MSSILDTIPAEAPEFQRSSKRFIKAPDNAAKEKKVNEALAKMKSIDAEINKITTKLNTVKIDDATSKERNKLQEELKTVIKEQGDLSKQRGVILDQIKKIEASKKQKSTELSTQTSKIRFKSIKEIDNEIQKLDDSISTGGLKIVEEKKVVKEITALRKLRKDFNKIEEAHNYIKQENEKIAELKKELNKYSNKEIQKRFEETAKQLDEVRGKTKTVSEQRQALFDARKKLYGEKDKLRAEITTVKKEHQEAYNKFKEELAKENERIKVEEEEFNKKNEKILKGQALKKELENAKKPAYQGEINKIKVLVKVLSKMSNQEVPEAIIEDDEAQSNVVAKSTENKIASSGIGSTRVIEKSDDLVLIKKEEEVFFQGKKGKGKKGKGKKSDNEKFVMEPDLIVQISELNLEVPTSKENAKGTIEKLMEKFETYKKDQKSATEANIAKVEAKIAEFAKEYSE